MKQEAWGTLWEGGCAKETKWQEQWDAAKVSSRSPIPLFWYYRVLGWQTSLVQFWDEKWLFQLFWVHSLAAWGLSCSSCWSSSEPHGWYIRLDLPLSGHARNSSIREESFTLVFYRIRAAMVTCGVVVHTNWQGQFMHCQVQEGKRESSTVTGVPFLQPSGRPRESRQLFFHCLICTHAQLWRGSRCRWMAFSPRRQASWTWPGNLTRRAERKRGDGQEMEW